MRDLRYDPTKTEDSRFEKKAKKDEEDEEDEEEDRSTDDDGDDTEPRWVALKLDKLKKKIKFFYLLQSKENKIGFQRYIRKQKNHY